jgi:phytoene/squalene synthetase
MSTHPKATWLLASDITRTASKQTYYTIRFLVDRDLVTQAYLAYAYFRWVDDIVDADTGTKSERLAFLRRQRDILEVCYGGHNSEDVTPEEAMLVDLIKADRDLANLGKNEPDTTSGLQIYLSKMMSVMEFDVERRGRGISQCELDDYSRSLAIAVTEALHYFIGHDCATEKSERRYLAVRAAHITHMLRDAGEDTTAGYFNIPQKYSEDQELSYLDFDHPSYRDWVSNRINLARRFFQIGREYIAQVRNMRCQLAGYAYIARFEWMLKVIEHDGYRLRGEYPERKSVGAGLWMVWRTASSLFASELRHIGGHKFLIRPIHSRIDEN